jgi:5-formyltetrahydrofolate cyclo-ligase
MAEDKATLRRRMRAWRSSVSATQLGDWSTRIQANIIGLPEWREARVVMLFNSLPQEVQLPGLPIGGKRVVWPAVEGMGKPLVLREGDCDTTGPRGILQPGPDAPIVAPQDIDVVIVPALALTLEGARLGYGGGFYDRTLARMGAVRVAVAFDEQIVDTVPTEDHDVVVDWIITQSRRQRAL